jgi:hypothetical protein
MNASKPAEGSELPSEKASDNSDLEECVWQESNLRPAASKFVQTVFPRRPERPDPLFSKGLASQGLP